MKALALSMRLLVASAVVGCAGPAGHQRVADSRADLDAAVVCCTNLAEANRSPLPTGKDAAVVVIDRTRQVFDFGTHKAYFVLYVLPPFRQAYSVEFSSESQGPHTDATLFIPRVMLLDSEFKPTRSFDDKGLRHRGSQVERTIFINEKDAAERYVVVYGSDLATTIERTYAMITATPVFAGPVMFNMVSGSDQKGIVRSSPVGALRLQVNGLEPATR
jgi:hypothetical protein